MSLRGGTEDDSYVTERLRLRFQLAFGVLSAVKVALWIVASGVPALIVSEALENATDAQVEYSTVVQANVAVSVVLAACLGLSTARSISRKKKVQSVRRHSDALEKKCRELKRRNEELTEKIQELKGEIGDKI